MIALSLATIAEAVAGKVAGPVTGGGEAGDIVVTGPVVIDSREARPGSLFVAFAGEHADGHAYAEQAGEHGAVAVLGTRVTALPTVVVSDVQRALGRLAAFVVARVRESGRLTVVALTGSQGKTSTKDLLAAVLGRATPTVATRGSYNNEIGMPLTALGVEPHTRYLVLEMGARGQGHLTELTDLVAPDIAVVLNVGTAHLGEFGSREAIAQAKGELVEALRPGGTAVLNADDARVAAMAARTGREGQHVVTFGCDHAAGVRVEGLVFDRLGRPCFELVTARERTPVTLRLVGAHQALNAAAAAAAALAAGLALPAIGEALAGVETLSRWRMELSERDDGVIVLNDAYNANPESMRAGLDALATLGRAGEVTRTIAVLGEMRELGESAGQAHREVGAYAVAQGVDVVAAVGEAARGIAAGAGERGLVLADNEAALAWLTAHLTSGDAVLFKASHGARLFELATAFQ